MIKQSREIPRIPVPETKTSNPLAKLKEKNNRDMQRRAEEAQPDLAARRAESDELLAQARARAQEALGIHADTELGLRARARATANAQEAAARSFGHASTKDMQKKATEEKMTLMQNAAAWFERTFGIKIGNAEDDEEQKAA